MLKLRNFTFAAVLLGASTALASTVYLNGVAVDGMTGQKFSNATVTFDEKGNVHIDVQGVEVKTLGGDKAAAPAAPVALAKHYFLVPQQAQTGMSGYDIDVFVNGKWIVRFRGEEDANPVDATKFVHPGANEVLFTAHKLHGERKSFSTGHTFSVLVGEGTSSSDQVVIDNPLLTFKRSAAETDDVSEKYTFTAH